MAKVDEMKEILNSLRVGMSIIVGLLVIIVGATINLERNNEIGIYFYFGLVSSIILIIAFLQIIRYIKKFTRKIKDL